MKFKLFFFLPILFYSCNLKETKSDYQPESFTFFVAQKSNVSVYEEYPSTIEGQIDLEIRASVEGYIMNVLIDEGQFVKAGQVLFEIDSRPFNENIKDASANLSVAESKRQQAQLEVDQLVPLVRDRVVSEIELKSAQIKLRTADKIVNQAQSFLDAAILKSYTKIVAPVDGYVGRLLKKKGSLVTQSDLIPLTHLSDNTL